MKTIRATQQLNCSAERFWALYFDETFTRALFVEGMGWDDPEIEVKRDDEEMFVRRMAAQPKLDIPGSVARMISKTLGYEEDGRFDKKRERWVMRHSTNIFGDKLDLKHIFTVDDQTDDDGEGRCKLNAEVVVNAKIFGVGGLLERVIETNVHKILAQNTKFINDWVARHPA